jgi:hypothetical protein
VIERFEEILLMPYRPPFDSETLDVVVSTSVLEDAHNKKTIV